MRKGRDGSLIKHWFGAYKDKNGKRLCKALETPILGHPPSSLSLREQGDDLFEQSRREAEVELDGFRIAARRKGRAIHLTEELIEEKTGRAIEYVKLEELPAKWRAIGRESQPTDARLKWCDMVFRRFAEALPCKYLHEVTPEQTSCYIDGLRKDHARSTVSGTVQLLRSAFARLLPVGMASPFEGRINRRGADSGDDIIHRRPLTVDELVTLFETARLDSFVYPLAVCAALTGLRIGDVCQLTWQSVDFRAGVIAIRTSKTGKGVEIPIFRPLREVLESALVLRVDDCPFVWPEAAKMYKTNRQGIVYRGKALFARALAKPVKGGGVKSAISDKPAVERVKLAEVIDCVTATVSERFKGAKRARILDTVRRYANGQSYRRIEVETGRKRGQTSEDLQDAERVTGLRIRHGELVASGRAVKALIGTTRQAREGGKGSLAASILGWHSLRGTWATLALSAGVPVETVRLVTGHSTANTVLKFYFNPQREHLRAVLGDKLPDVLTGVKAGMPTKHRRVQVKKIADQIMKLSKDERAWLMTLIGGAA